MAAIAGLGVVAATRVWPAGDPVAVEHLHRDLAAGHPHLTDARPSQGGHTHAYDFVINDQHMIWPRN